RGTGGSPLVPCHEKLLSPDLLEVMVDDVATNVTSKGCTLLVGAEVVEADEDARQVDVAHDVLQAAVGARRTRNPTIEREGDVVGAEEGVQRRDDRAAVAGMRRR